ncbi:T3SS effector HopA1 family protein [Bacillus halotolerans]|uniref:T3SS effector HopA1 family protein n=1 Tax=Bacillus halotolerans TaxID=260554 RepID=UPI002DB6814B|nr:T3SS effector HopA1 family protein [Bacillus halotolerans]MEC1601794.1 T3SS effector HopA1 family protein [Bacillus halotolerans]
MKNSTNSINELYNLLSLKPDLDTIIINGEKYSEVLKKPKSQLVQWLYCTLHTGNLSLMDNIGRYNGTNLDNKISESVKDPTLLVPAKDVKIKDSSLVEVDGVRISSKLNSEGTISLPCFRPNLTPGFFMFVHTNSGQHGQSVQRHYIAADNPDYAISVWSKSISRLVKEKLSFSGKVLSNTSSYPRNDAIVFYSSEDSDKVEKILTDIVVEHPNKEMPGSLLYKKITYNLYTAEEPIIKRGVRQSFGENRCSAIADAIQDHFITNVDFKLLLKQRLKAYNINPEDLSKNILQ